MGVRAAAGEGLEQEQGGGAGATAPAGGGGRAALCMSFVHTIVIKNLDWFWLTLLRYYCVVNFLLLIVLVEPIIPAVVFPF